MNSDRIKLNVGGTLFETTQSTLSQSSFFRSYLERWKVGDKKVEEPLFIDRSGVLFEHVLSLLRNPEYPYPITHIGELNYYGIKYEEKETEKEKKLSPIDELKYRVLKNAQGLCANYNCENSRMRQIGFQYCFECGEIYPSPEKEKSFQRGDAVLYKENICYYYLDDDGDCYVSDKVQNIGDSRRSQYVTGVYSLFPCSQRKKLITLQT